jgi:hypothetical protein
MILHVTPSIVLIVISGGGKKNKKPADKEPEDDDQEDQGRNLKFQVASKTINVIFGGDGDFGSRRDQKLLLREIMSIEPVTVHVLVMLDIYFVRVKYVFVCIKLMCAYVKLLKI